VATEAEFGEIEAMAHRRRTWPPRQKLVTRVAVVLSLQAQQALAQRGIASLNDPCDCMQHHDYWMATRTSLLTLLQVPDFAERIFDDTDPLSHWVKVQSCMYSPENEEAHRPTALSDCIPGFLFTHVVCIQRHIVDRKPERVLAYATELARLLPWGVNCMDQSGWPFTLEDMTRYYRRLLKTIAVGPAFDEPWPEGLLREMAWRGGEAELARITTGTRSDGEASLSEEAEVCPLGSFSHLGACWLLGETGASCREACDAGGLTFLGWRRRSVSDPLVPYLLALREELPETLLRQGPWAPFECYVAGQDRFHLADVESFVLDEGTALAADDNAGMLLERDRLALVGGSWGGAGDWKYSLCSLACPCSPKLPELMNLTLELAPTFPVPQ